MFEAYSVGIRVSLINGVTAGLLGLSRQFRGADHDAKSLQNTLTRIGKLAAVGTAFTATGVFGLSLIGKSVSAAKEYGNELARLNQLGMSQKDVASAVAASWRTTYDVPTSRIAENIHAYRELRSLFGSRPEQEAEARMMLPMVQRLSGVMYAMTGQRQEHIGFDVSKAAEMRTPGAMTPQALQKNMDMMSRALIAMGGTLTVADFHSTFKQAKMATMKWSDEFAYGLLPSLMQEMKSGPKGTAQSAGTAMMSLYRVIHGRMEKAAAPLWEQLGLLNARDIVKNSGGAWQMKPGAIAGTEVFERNPLEWVAKYLAPNLDRVAKSQHISVESLLDKMASNRNAGFALYTMYKKGQQFQRDHDLIAKAKTSEQAYNDLVKTSPLLAKEALSAQFDNAKVVIGYQLLPDLLKIMQTLVPVLRDWTLWMREHPKLLGVAVKGFAALSAVLVTLGGLANFATIALAFHEFFGLFKKGQAVEEAAVVAARGTPFLTGIFTAIETFAVGLGWWIVPVTAGLVAIGGAIAFIARGWDRNKGIWQNVKDGLHDYWDWIVKQGKDALQKVKTLGATQGQKALGAIHKLENPSPTAKQGAKDTAFWLNLFHGMYAGARDAAAPYSRLAKETWENWATGWDKSLKDFTSGVTGYLNRMRGLAALAHKLMPWAFADPAKVDGAPKPGPKAKPSSQAVDFSKPADIGRFGRMVGGATVDSLAGAVLQGFGLPSGLTARRAVVPPPRAGMKQPINTTVYLDGREIAKAVTVHQERGLERAARGSASGFDARRSLAPVGLGVA